MSIPKDQTEAMVNIEELLAANVAELSKEQFLKGWAAIAFEFPGLHPDDVPQRAPKVKPHHKDRQGLFRHYDRKSGWPLALIAVCNEAWRRFESGELTDDELYHCEAQKAGLLAAGCDPALIL